jgi:hypothetical protein
MRKVEKIEKKLIWSVIEEMIDEITTVQAYSTYVNSSIKKDTVKVSNKITKGVVKQMTLEVAMETLADLKINNVLLTQSEMQEDNTNQILNQIKQQNIALDTIETSN